MLRIAKYLKPYLLMLVVLIVLVYIQVATSLKLPDLMAKIINEGIVQENNSLILHTGLQMLAYSFVGGIAMVIVGFLASKIAAGYSKDIRHRVFAKVESFSLVEFNKFSTASLITRSTNDVQQIQMVLIMILRLVLMAPIMGVWAVIKAYNTAPSMTWIMGLAVGILLATIVLLFSVALPKFKALQSKIDRLNLIMRQILTGLRVIRAFNAEKKEEKNFDQANVELTDLQLFVNRLMVIMQPLMMLIFNLTAVATVWVGAHLIDTGNLQIGNMLAFMQYSMQVIMSFLFLSIIFIMIPRASVSGDRIADVLATEPTIVDPKDPVRASAANGKVEFKNVYFTYPGADAPVLEDISFSALPGQTTAFIGSTGSGKSTIINLIPRFYDITAGEILVDDVNIKQMKQEELWRKIGYVPQKGVLFSGTVESNIKYGNPKATEKEVDISAKISQADEFINSLPEKLQNAIAQGGTNVSGGQKQRLSIARAIVRDPEIYIFDDSFSALDFKTDANLRHALKKGTKDKTVLIVGQRISTIMDAEKIIVLDEGKIVGQGNHEELIKNCPVYKEIALSQLSEKELASYRKERLKIPRPELREEAT